MCICTSSDRSDMRDRILGLAVCRRDDFPPNLICGTIAAI